jgi:hypothetical protein
MDTTLWWKMIAAGSGWKSSEQFVRYFVLLRAQKLFSIGFVTQKPKLFP